MPGERHCPSCGSVLGDDNTCPNCGHGSPSVSTTTTTGSHTATATTSSTIDVMVTSATITPPPLDMSKFRFTIGGKLFELDNLNEEMNSLFREFHVDHYGGSSCDKERFRQKSLEFFDVNQGRAHHHVHDQFFQNFSIIWKNYLENQRFDGAEKLWKFALHIAYDWEDGNLNSEIHKGTPYYFWAVTCIMSKKLDEAFLLMHQALDEDKKTHGTGTPDTPAYAFVTLDPTQKNQFFREKVIEISDFVKTLLANYRSARGGGLGFLQFQSQFLRQARCTGDSLLLCVRSVSTEETSK